MLDAFREVWAVDFEFVAPPGERPTPVCLVARELKSGRTIRLWRDQFGHFRRTRSGRTVSSSPTMPAPN